MAIWASLLILGEVQGGVSAAATAGGEATDSARYCRLGRAGTGRVGSERAAGVSGVLTAVCGTFRAGRGFASAAGRASLLERTAWCV